MTLPTRPLTVTINGRRYGLIDENGEVWSSEFSAYLLRSR